MSNIMMPFFNLFYVIFYLNYCYLFFCDLIILWRFKFIFFI